MNLHVNVTVCKVGLIFKKSAWKLSAMLELTAKEAELLAKHKELRTMVIASGLAEHNRTVHYSVGVLAKGSAECIFYNHENMDSLQRSLRAGTATLRDKLESLSAPRIRTTEA